ncbi:hypothetical protein MNB_SV-6-207 [hydrothermal vent metagenome]|uniref:DUF3373 domain-containing protein n=1 Tax=hydrothermal vent metagenome TaxID=652676 RepID=A0A1W1BH01_9ZZZZ
MKRIVSISLVAATMALGSTADDIADLQKQIDKLKKQVIKNKKQSANDNIKWGVDLRTSIDSINYDMADGKSYENNSLMAMRLWLNMAYAADEKNIFKGQLSMNKAFGADFRDPFNTPGGNRTFSLGGMFDWTGNEALTDNSLKVRRAFWLYLGDDAFGQGIDWTFSIGRRPSTNGFLGNLSQDDSASSPLAHVINVEFDGFSSKLDLSKITGVDGMSFKVCLGQGSTNAAPLFANSTPYAEEDDQLNGISLGGFIFEPYNDGQFIVKTTWYRAFDLPGMDVDMSTGQQLGFKQYGDMDGAAISILVDGVTEDGYGSDVKVFGSYAWSKTDPLEGEAMLGSMDSETGSSYWFGAYLPVGESARYGTLGLEYNHGDQYWRPFTYAEDTMIGSKLAARGDAFELNYTYQITKALSLQARYVNIDYDYTGSQGFFGNTSGASMAIDDVKDGAAAWRRLGGTSDPDSAQVVVGNLMASGMSQEQAVGAATQMGMAASFLPSIVESAQDFRFYLRYRF